MIISLSPFRVVFGRPRDPLADVPAAGDLVGLRVNGREDELAAWEGRVARASNWGRLDAVDELERGVRPRWSEAKDIFARN